MRFAALRTATALLVASALLILLALFLPDVAFGDSRLARRTPISEVSLARALYAGHRDAFKGAKPGGRRLAVAWSQAALETGRGARMRGYDVGNVGGRTKSFPTARSGAAAYWKAVAKCESVLAYFDAGDASGAALQLGRCRYYSASPSAYASGMESLRSTFTKSVWPKVRGMLGH